MRIFLFVLFLLNMPVVAGATTQVQPTPGSATEYEIAVSDKKAGVKHGFLKRVAEKILLRRLKKALKRAENPAASNGEAAAIFGLIFALIGVILWIIDLNLGAIMSLPLGVLGLILSIVGLSKAKRNNDKGVKTLATIGLILNILLLGSLFVIAKN